MTDLPVHLIPRPDGVDLAWREVGSGRPFLLLHGLMGSGALLAGQALVLALADRAYRVILPDLRGHGDSGRPDDPVSVPTLVVVGDQDSRGMSAGSLAALLPHGQFVEVPGDHVTALGAPEFTAAILEFLGKTSSANASL